MFRSRKLLLTIFFAGFLFTSLVLFLWVRSHRLSFSTWLDGAYCEGFCWQKISSTDTTEDLELLLDDAGLSYTGPAYNYYWVETQKYVADGRVSAIFRSFDEPTQHELLRILAGVDVCVSTIIDTLGIPNTIYESEASSGHYTILYFDPLLGEGWAFSFRDVSLPYAEVVMRIYNDTDFSLDMTTISWDSLSSLISESCVDNFNQ